MERELQEIRKLLERASAEDKYFFIGFANHHIYKHLIKQFDLRNYGAKFNQLNSQIKFDSGSVILALDLTPRPSDPHYSKLHGIRFESANDGVILYSDLIQHKALGTLRERTKDYGKLNII